VFVAPVSKSAVPAAIAKLNPRIEIAGETHFAVMQEMAAVLRKNLGAVRGSASDQHTSFVAAIDLIFTGI
jgi:CcdB protein